MCQWQGYKDKPCGGPDRLSVYMSGISAELVVNDVVCEDTGKFNSYDSQETIAKCKGERLATRAEIVNQLNGAAYPGTPAKLWVAVREIPSNTKDFVHIGTTDGDRGKSYTAINNAPATWADDGIDSNGLQVQYVNWVCYFTKKPNVQDNIMCENTGSSQSYSTSE